MRTCLALTIRCARGSFAREAPSSDCCALCVTRTGVSIRGRSPSTRSRRWSAAESRRRRSRREAANRGVHLVDADSAPFGEFDLVQLAGLVDGEWPDRPRRNIFYSAAILRELGWPADADRLEGIRASFTDLLRLPVRELAISTFSLEHDSIVAPSILIDEIAGGSGLGRVFRPAPRPALQTKASSCRMRRADGPCADSQRPADSIAGGQTSGHAAKAYSVSALERYQDCPFKFFASDVLQLDELPEDEAALSPRARGRFIHEVFQRFFEAWDRARRRHDYVRPAG